MQASEDNIVSNSTGFGSQGFGVRPASRSASLITDHTFTSLAIDTTSDHDSKFSEHVAYRLQPIQTSSRKIVNFGSHCNNISGAEAAQANGPPMNVPGQGTADGPESGNANGKAPLRDGPWLNASPWAAFLNTSEQNRHQTLFAAGGEKGNLLGSDFRAQSRSVRVSIKLMKASFGPKSKENNVHRLRCLRAVVVRLKYWL